MLNKQRVEALTDAILAIIMTIMILEVHMPEGYEWSDLSKVFIPLVAFVISFFSLVNLWLGHHEIFKRTGDITYGVFWINMILLFWVSTLPVATAWVAEYPTRPLPQAVFCVIGIGWACLLSLLSWQVDLSKNEDHSKFPWNEIWHRNYIWLIGLVLSLFLPYIALILGIITVLRVAIVASLPRRN
ncbi:TMEM175 family protein [Pediococcus argentinicus]|uniref:Integral membrane protein n=1 Tax=Pediococcus argentinicus TaxID=480391 RepID=A0A0R2NGD5_9LACO|nr:TMEM175 family protein [Pediococcus argentinicus]KRO24887.1 integral membrane protein [Pediococcus argentinicus]NKZ22584.1 DUF1211 domain-containing protein [Pediococcus argentinicus]GEP19755.1 ferrochelatase [Pediococcus argentinicus]